MRATSVTTRHPNAMYACCWFRLAPQWPCVKKHAVMYMYIVHLHITFGSWQYIIRLSNFPFCVPLFPIYLCNGITVSVQFFMSHVLPWGVFHTSILRSTHQRDYLRCHHVRSCRPVTLLHTCVNFHLECHYIQYPFHTHIALTVHKNYLKNFEIAPIVSYIGL